LNERNQTHGDFADNARIAQRLKAVMRQTRNWHRLTNVQRESLEMQAHKQARILAGDPFHADSWHDIGGYAKLAEKEAERAGANV
jgi:hypothetical protein